MYLERERSWAIQYYSQIFGYINNNKNLWVLAAWNKSPNALWDCSRLCMQSSHSWPEIVWCSWGLWVKPGSFCLPCLLRVVWPSTLLHSGPGNWRTVSHLVDSVRTSYGLLSQVSLSILHIMVLLAICTVFVGFSASVLSSACCKPVNGMPSEKQDGFHILKFETTGTCVLSKSVWKKLFCSYPSS